MKIGLKRILSLLLVLCFMGGLAPVVSLPASAGAPMKRLYVGDTSVIPDNQNTCYYWKEASSGDGAYEEGDVDDYLFSVEYNGETITLTMKSMAITTYYEDHEDNSLGIYSQGVNLNIVLNGAVTIDNQSEVKGIGIYSMGNVSIWGGAEGSLTISSSLKGIHSSDDIEIANAVASITTTYTRGVSVFAEGDIRISGSSHVTIVDWSLPDVKCGLKSFGNIAIGGAARVDIVSRSAGMYASETVYIGYEWDGAAYAAAGKPTLLINDPGSISAAEAANGGASFAAGISGIEAKNTMLLAGTVTINADSGPDYEYAMGIYCVENVMIYGGSITVNAIGDGSNIFGIAAANIAVSGGRLTATGNKQAVYAWATISFPSVPYKYKYSTEAAEPGIAYILSGDTPCAYSATHKYLQMGQIYAVTYDENRGDGAVPTESGKIGGETFAAPGCELTPPPGKAFKEWNTMEDGTGTRYLPGDTVTMPEGALSLYAIWGTPVSISAVSGVTAPVRGAAPVTAVTETAEYTGSVTWAPANNPFAAGTSYTATITLTPKGKYILAGVTQNFFTVAGATTVTNNAGSGVITAVFPATEAIPSFDDDEIYYPPEPPEPEYKADVQAGGGSASTLPVTVNEGEGSASVDTGAQALTALGAVVSIPAVPDAGTYIIGIPVPDLSTTERQGSLTVETRTGSITVPSNMLTGVGGADGSKAQIAIGEADKERLPGDARAAIGDKPVIKLTLSVDGRQTDWSNPEAPVTVGIPYTPTAEELINPESIVIWYIDGSGNIVTIPDGRYDAASGTVIFSTTHFSDYAVVFNSVAFSDVAADAWYNRAVSFIASRNITDGTGSGNFSPDAQPTRGEFIVLLMRACAIAPDENPVDNFSDAGSTYYTNYIAAAKRLGVSTGVGDNRFEPDSPITRQEMFAMLYNALKALDKLPRGDSGRALSDFSDSGSVADYAQEAITFLVSAGIIRGSNGLMTPAATTTRAEIAQVLYTLLAR